MKFRKIASVLSALVCLAVPQLASAQALTLGEQFIVRSYAGQLEGQVINNVLKAETLGIAVNNSTICVALAGALTGEFVGHNKSVGLAAAQAGETPKRRLNVVAYASADDASKAVEGLKDMAAIALLFGGQKSDEENYASVKNTLQGLAGVNYPGALFLHLTVAAKKWVPQAAAEDAAVAAYLAKKTNVYALGVNVEKKMGVVNQQSFSTGPQPTEQVAFQTPLNDGFLNLFKRRLLTN